VTLTCAFFLNECQPDQAGLRSWAVQNETDFAALKAQLPDRLAIHRETTDQADQDIRAAAKDPVMKVGPPFPVPL
jgi:hypothetical protein